MVVEVASGKNHVPAPKAQTVYVTYSGEKRSTPMGVELDPDGWWEICGLPFAAAMEVAYTLSNGRPVNCHPKHDMEFERYSSGCTFVVKAGTPDKVG